MATVRGWKVWYGPTEVLTGWDALPDDGIQCVVIYYAETDGLGQPRRLVLSGDDYYFLAPELDHPVCSNDPPTTIRDRYPGAVIKRGRWASAATFSETTRLALADIEVP